MICALIVKRSKAWFAHFLVSSHGVSHPRLPGHEFMPELLGMVAPLANMREWDPRGDRNVRSVRA
jgi:hypothetical protein